MEFFDKGSAAAPSSQRGGPLRDHLHYSDATRAYMRSEAEKKMGYRSEEQAYTDHRQGTGFATRGPVAFGKYEVGRSSMPGNREDDGRAVFSDTMKRGIVHQHMDGYGGDPSGDPGAYNPFTFSEIRHTAAFTHNQSKAPFGMLADRTLKLDITGKDNPHGPGAYDIAKAVKYIQPLIADNRNVFRSETPQREVHATSVPGPNHYTPKMQSVYPNVRDSGASMRGSLVRLAVMKHPDHVGGDPSMTDANIGPGAYDEHHYNTIATMLEKAQSRTSRLQPAFGTMSPQRELPYGQKDESPGPGAYQPLVWGGRYSKGGEISLRTRRTRSGAMRARASPKKQVPKAAPPPSEEEEAEAVPVN